MFSRSVKKNKNKQKQNKQQQQQQQKTEPTTPKSNENQEDNSLMWTPRLLQSRLGWKSPHNYRHSLINNKQRSPQQHLSRKGCEKGKGRRRRRRRRKKKKWSEWCCRAGRIAANPGLSIFIGAFVCAKSKGAHKVKPAPKPRLYFYIQ